MLPSTNFVKSSTPVSTVSSLATTNTTNTSTAVQSGPYTKAQFQNTMEGSRTVKNAKEVEQLLRDYPAALELYRTGRYKVKIKNEADVERVILVEKRANKNITSNVTKTNDLQQNQQSVPDTSNNADKIKEDLRKERKIEQAHSRTQSQDRPAPITSVSDNTALVPTTTSSMHVSNQTQPKVDHHRTPSKDGGVSVASQPKQQSPRRSHSRDDSRSKVSHSKHKGKKSNRDDVRAIVPYVPNTNSAGTMWQQSRAMQPYYSNPVLPYQQPMGNMYMPPTFVPQQNPFYQQPYYYGQIPFPALAYQNQPVYPPSSTGSATKQKLYSSHNQPSSSSSSKTIYNGNYGANLPPSFQTFYSNQQQYSHPNAMYHSQIPYQTAAPWPTMTNRPAGHVANNSNIPVENRHGSKNRARSVDTGPRRHPPVHYYNQQQQQPASKVIEHHHRHHHHRSHPTNVQTTTTNTTTGPHTETGKDQNAPLKETTTAVNNGTNGEKLTIRQLNEIFVQTDPSGRLPYSSLPNILQRFGISLAENDLTSAAQSLDYNPAEPLSARRLVHVLVKLGKIAKSAQQQPRPAGSPSILPEDREVNDIMTQRRAIGVPSTHIHSSVYPNRWY